MLVITTALDVLYAFVTTRTVIGRQIYAVGGNAKAARSTKRSVARWRGPANACADLGEAMVLHKSGVTPALLLQCGGTTYQRRCGIRPNAR